MLVREPNTGAWRCDMWIQLKLSQPGLNMSIGVSSKEGANTLKYYSDTGNDLKFLSIRCFFLNAN